jgi:hypothetical protein
VVEIRCLAYLQFHATISAYAFLLLQGNVNASGLLAPFGGYWGQSAYCSSSIVNSLQISRSVFFYSAGFLGDWLTPHGSELSGSSESILFNNCILVYALRVAAKVREYGTVWFESLSLKENRSRYFTDRHCTRGRYSSRFVKS